MGVNNNETSLSRNLLITIFLNGIITLFELLGGLFSHSLALISDSFHNFSDSASGFLAFYTYKLSLKNNNAKFTFGYRRAEILSAIFNASLLVALSAILLKEAITRFVHPEVVNGSIMLIVALIGLAANVFSVLLLYRHARKNLNIKSVYLHLLTDAFSSVSVVFGAILIYFFKLYWLDPVFTIIIVTFIAYEGIKVIIQTINIFMECSPSWINISEVRKDIESMPGIQDLHHVHIWMLSDNITLFEAHININNITISETKEIRLKIEALLSSKYKINHSTIQFEYEEHEDEGLIKGHFY
jgi:cobalt-zinc-cadmium efflux system protein